MSDLGEAIREIQDALAWAAVMGAPLRLGTITVRCARCGLTVTFPAAEGPETMVARATGHVCPR